VRYLGRRRPRYRRRFLTHTRTCQRQLQLLEVPAVLGQPLNDKECWDLLLRGLSLKGAQETIATHDGREAAILSAKTIFRSFGVLNPRADP